MSDAPAHRSDATASLIAAHQAERNASLRARLERLLALDGSEHALDVGTGAGALAIALAPLVAEVVGVDVDAELLDEARRRSPPATAYLEADAVALPFDAGAFDLVGSAGMLHHMPHPDRALAEMARVLRPGGTMLVGDRLATADAGAARPPAHVEHAHGPSTARILTDAELRGLLAATGLELRATEVERESHDPACSLDHAGRHGSAREHAAALAPAEPAAAVGWYVLAKPGRPAYR